MKKLITVCFLWLLCVIVTACSSSDSNNNSNSAVNKRCDYLKESTKRTFLNYEVNDIDQMYSENSFRAKEFFDDRDIGIVGKIDSITSDGDKFFIRGNSNGWNIVCSCKDDSAKECIKKVSVGDRVLVCGNVTVSEYTEFSLEAEVINKIDDTLTISGFSDSKGNLCLDKEWKEKEIGLLKFYYCTQWTEKVSDIFSSGFEYVLGSDESVKVFCVDYNDVKRQAENQNNDGEEWWSIKEKGEVEDYLTYKLSPERIEYKTSSEKIGEIKFDYYGGIAENKSSGQKNEIYYGKIGDDKMIIVDYLYKGDPVHTTEVAALMSTIRIE